MGAQQRQRIGHRVQRRVQPAQRPRQRWRQRHPPVRQVVGQNSAVMPWQSSIEDSSVSTKVRPVQVQVEATPQSPRPRPLEKAERVRVAAS